MLYLELFKLNYSDSLTHYISYEEENLTNQLLINRSILPRARQTIQDGTMLNLNNIEYHVIEKKYLIDELAEKVYYFTELFLEDTPQPSLKGNISIIKKSIISAILLLLLYFFIQSSANLSCYHDLYLFLLTSYSVSVF